MATKYQLTEEDKEQFKKQGQIYFIKKHFQEKVGKDMSKAPSLPPEELEQLSQNENFLQYNWLDPGSDVRYGSGNDLYVNAYKIFQNYPDWMVRLNNNPWTYFQVPLSLFDELGLSNKAHDKIASYQQNYNKYISDLVNEFYAWKNSLPETQREQLNEAGYNADLASVGQSQMSTPDIAASDPSQLASGNTGQELLTAISSACSVVSAGISTVLSIGSTMSSIGLQMSQKKGIDLVNAGKELSNYEQARNIAKTLYGASAGEPKPDVLENAPELVKKAYQDGQLQTDFEASRLKSSTDLSKSDTDWMLQTMRYENVKDVFGDEDYWQGNYKIAQDAYNQGIKKYRDYVEAFDSVTQARSQNGYNEYMEKFYAGLDAETASLLVNQQNSVSFESLQEQSLLIKRNLAIYENDWKTVEAHYKILTDPNAPRYQKIMSAIFLSLGGVADRLFLHPERAAISIPGNTGFGSPAASGPGFPLQPLF